MAMFSYLYYNSYVGAEVGVTVGSVLSSAVQLSRREQLELWGLLANLLAGMSPPTLVPDRAKEAYAVALCGPFSSFVVLSMLQCVRFCIADSCESAHVPL